MMLEAIMAAFILTLIIAYATAVWTTHGRGIAKARYDMMGRFLATQKLEECIEAGIDGQGALEDPLGSTVTINAKINGNATTTTYTRYVVCFPDSSVDSAAIVAGGNAPLRSIQVRVTWTDPNGNAREARVESLVAGTP